MVAPAWKRAAAFYVDLIVAGIPLAACLVVAWASIGTGNSDGWMIPAIMAASAAGWSYFVALETVSGATLGKRVFGIRVEMVDGTRCTFRAAVIRNLLLPIDGLPGGLLGLMFIMSTRGRQRLGDICAGTVVVDTREVGS